MTVVSISASSENESRVTFSKLHQEKIVTAMITHRLLALEVLTAFLVLLLVENQRLLMVQAFGYSYSRFIGPVRGPERQIIVHDRYDGRGRIDYVARPEYQFAYGVEDAKTRVLQNRRETRNGDAVKGVYSVVDPDGSLRVVKYTADNVNGFQAEVISNGVSTNHGQDNPVVVHPDPQQLVDNDGADAVGGDEIQVNAKDKTKPHQINHHIQVQHPEKTSQISHENGVAKVKNIPAKEEINHESSDSKDASEYQEEEDDDDDGGKSSESRNESLEKDDDDSSEEVEDY